MPSLIKENKKREKLGTCYDEPYHWKLKGLFLEINLSKVNFVKKNLSSNQRILDVGCGDGFATNLLSKDVSEVIGLDVSISSLRFAKVRCEGIQFVLASATVLPFRPKCFDVVTMFDVIEHLYPADANEAVHETHRVLRIGSKFMITTPNPLNLRNIFFRKRKVSEKHPREYSQKELLRLLQDFETIIITGAYLPLPILEWLSKPTYGIIYRPLITLGTVIPSLAKSTFWCGKKTSVIA